MRCTHSHDRWGFLLSALCLIHCLALPVILSMGYLWASNVAGHLLTHIGFFAFAIVIVYRRLKFLKPSQKRIRSFFILSLSFLLIGLLAEGLFHLHRIELVSTVMGSCGLMVGHLYCEFFS